MTKYVVIRDQFTTNYQEVEADGQKGVVSVPTPIVDVIEADDYDVKYEALRLFSADDEPVATYAKGKWVGIIKQDEPKVVDLGEADYHEVEVVAEPAPVYDATNKD